MRWSVVLLTACEGIGVVHGDGVEGQDQRSLGRFDGVHNEMNVDVFVSEGEPGASIRCDDNLIDLIHTELRGSTLHIQLPFATGIWPTVPCTVDVTVPSLASLDASGSGSIETNGVWPDLREIDVSGSGEVFVAGDIESLADIHVSGSGNVEVADLRSSDLAAHVSGSGTVTLSGVADFVDFDIRGSGDVAARDLTTEDADIKVSGSGNTELTALGAVDVHLSGSGDVWLWGNPSVESDVSGSGDVHLE
jgi:hypothetical protein